MIADRSFRGLLKRITPTAAAPKFWELGTRKGDLQKNDPTALCQTLMSTRGEASGIVIADQALTCIEALDDEGLLAFFHTLRDAFELDVETILDAATRAQSGEPTALCDLRHTAEPRRQELFRRLNAAPGGTARLVDMRKKLLRLKREDASLAPIDTDLRHLLRSWFNRGFLVPERIDWNTSASVLEKIIAYEAVHAIETWDHLRARLAPEDRRCYAFFHPAMPDEPLIFVEVALTKGIATSIQGVLDAPRAVLAQEDADTAIFYSISNCQAGLAGISFGAFLIKQVASDLKSELPNLKTFSTLSPVPGFAKWVEKTGIETTQLDEDEASLETAVAVYLAEAKGRGGMPRDPVAKFHLGNGAELHRINLGADLSDKGQTQSRAVMVNYLYELDLVEPRHEAFAESGTLALSREVETALSRERVFRTAKAS